MNGLPHSWYKHGRDGFILSRTQFHFSNKDPAKEDSNTLIAGFDLRIVAAGQSTPVQLNTVTREHKHQNYQQNRYLMINETGKQFYQFVKIN